MIKTFIRRLMSSTPTHPGLGKRQCVPLAAHRIDPQLVDDRALKVIHTLQDHGHQAYIVGGAVRDLLLGLRPKDFDVATDATPEQVKALFRRAFIIGRRFRIVHVIFGRGHENDKIEVSTFRAHLDNTVAEKVSGNERSAKSKLAGLKHAVDASGRVLRDNVWGPQDEDAARRDFTVNAMYYDPRTQEVIDYHKGFADIRKRVLRMIGDPVLRYREDPVRIIRAIRFVAKLSAMGFKLETRTAAPLRRSLHLLADVPPSRMFDEMLKLLLTGHALASIEKIQSLGLVKGIYPLLECVVERSTTAFVSAALRDTDRRAAEGRPVSPSFLLACVLWNDVRKAWDEHRVHQPVTPALQSAIDQVFESRIGDVSGRGRLAADMREIWLMQPRFDKRIGNGPTTLVGMARFRAGYDFFSLRAQTGDADASLADWWLAFSQADDSMRSEMQVQVRQSVTASVRSANSETSDPLKRRRRRRRKPDQAGSA